MKRQVAGGREVQHHAQAGGAGALDGGGELGRVGFHLCEQHVVGAEQRGGQVGGGE